VAVIRLSGPQVRSILDRVIQPVGRRNPVDSPRRMCTSRVVDQDGQILDEALVVFFPGPGSYTGEDLAEVHCHGGEVVVESVLARLVEAGARPAVKGEFTRRAFESGKMDLSRAEAVVRVIEAGTREQVIAAQRLLEGELGRELVDLRENLTGLLANLEALVDFPEEPETARAALGELKPQLERVRRLRTNLRRRVEPGCEVVIAGRPNVGKSSLINAVAGRPVSIVTDQPGTTRDAVSTGVVLAGLQVALIDTAGSGSGTPRGKVEREAARVAEEHIRRAALLVWLTDRPELDESEVPSVDGPVLWVANKSDLIEEGQRPSAESRVRNRGGLMISALTGQGIDDFLERTGELLAESYGPVDGVPVTTRQENLLARLHGSITRARDVLSEYQAELAAADLRDALEALGELLGYNLEPDVLDRIFSEFCIGK